VTTFRTAAFLLAGSLALGADTPAKPTKPVPELKMIMPLGVAAGQTTRVVVRGLQLENATEAKIVGAPGATVKLLKKTKLTLDKKEDPRRIGDARVELEIAVPASFSGHGAQIAMVAGGVESSPLPLFVVPKDMHVDEKEPNDGFRQAQPVRINQEIFGTIGRQQDVDVFRIECVAGQRLQIELAARSQGSQLDPIITLYDAKLRNVGSADSDSSKSRDVHLDYAARAAGPLFVCVQDANDKGSELHVYRLSIRDAVKR
jgi:hypothetical protein